MPKTTGHKKAAQRTGGALRKRNIKPGAGCQKSRYPKKATGAARSNSIFALSPQPIPGIVVEKKVDRKGWKREDDYDKMYEDLFAAYTNYCKITGCEYSAFDPLSAGLDIGKALYLLIERMKSVIPNSYSLNTEREDDIYLFRIFKEVDFQNNWHFFDIEPVVKYLSKSNKSLHDLFISALSLLHSCDIQTWYSGNLYAVDVLLYDDCYMNDYIDNTCEDEAEKESQLKIVKDLKESYSDGEVRRYQQLIEKSFIKPEALKRLIGKNRSRGPIKKWIQDVVSLALDGYRLRDFMYECAHDYSEDYMVRLQDQATIIWNDSDMVFAWTCEFMDNEAANFGVEPAIYSFEVSKDTRKIDIKNLDKAEAWMSKLTDLYNDYQCILKSIGHE